MTTKTLRGFRPLIAKKTAPPAAKSEKKNEVAKQPQTQSKGLDAQGRFKSNFEAGKQVNRDYNKTFGRGDTSDLFTPNSNQSKVGGALGKLLPSVSKEGSVGVRAVAFERGGSFNGLGGLAQGQGSVSLAEASASAKGRVAFEGGALKATGSAQASATLVNAQGSVFVGKGDYNLQAQGQAYVGAQAKASGELTIDPARGIYAAKVGGEAFAGARAGVEANVNLGKFGGAGAKAEAWAGVGAAFNVEAGFKNGRLKAKVDIGAALGVGFKLGFNVDIDVKGIKNAVTSVVKAPVEAVKNVAKSIGNGLKKLKFW
jgi:hypothetical protein